MHEATWGAGWLSGEAQAAFRAGLAECGRFFVDGGNVERALTKLVGLFEADGIPYAVIGGLALVQYGHIRVTRDVDVVLRDEDLARFKAKHLGHGYEERAPGTGKLRDTEHGVDVDVLSTGRFPGDGKPKPIAFPDPRLVAVRGDGFALLPLPRFLELKLASGMTAPHRLKDLADVIELVRAIHCPREVGDELDPSVRSKFYELWDAAQAVDPE